MVDLNAKYLLKSDMVYFKVTSENPVSSKIVQTLTSSVFIPGSLDQDLNPEIPEYIAGIPVT
jgi:hypothetical protein